MNKRHAGVWIDHRDAFIVFVGEGGEVHEIKSDVEKHVRFSGHAVSGHGSAEDQRDRQSAAHLEKYYDEVIAQIGDVGSLLILGPGEAKGEFQKRLAGKGHAGRVAEVETADKMTHGQIAAKVRQHYQK